MSRYYEAYRAYWTLERMMRARALAEYATAMWVLALEEAVND